MDNHRTNGPTAHGRNSLLALNDRPRDRTIPRMLAVPLAIGFMDVHGTTITTRTGGLYARAAAFKGHHAVHMHGHVTHEPAVFGDALRNDDCVTHADDHNVPP